MKSPSPPSPLSHRTPILRERGSSAAGYNLVMLMVLVTLLNIAVAVSLPAWSAVIRRDKEEELIFRGLQYAEAIRVFKIRFTRDPVRLEELFEVKPRAIRRLWKDPMTDKADWRLIPAQGPPGLQTEDPNGRKGEPDPENEEPEGEPEEEDDSFGAPKKEIQVGPFKGVQSRSRKTSFLLFNGKERYDEWHFTADLFATPSTPGGDPTGMSPPRARWIGRPFPAFLQPPQGTGLGPDALNPDRDRNRDPQGGSGSRKP